MINNKRNFSLNVFERASICRHFENEVYKRIVKKEIEFPVYLSAGQEYAPATIAEIVSKKKIKPLIFGQHRGHSIYLSFGGDINKLIKELKGKKDGCTYGMGGSLSIHSMKINMYGHDGFMGSNACIGTGACFSSKKPTIIFIGDAALEEDYVLASLSLVSKKKLPILFFVDDNNLKGPFTSWKKFGFFSIQNDQFWLHNFFNLSVDEYKKKLEKYNKSNKYPNIDK